MNWFLIAVASVPMRWVLIVVLVTQQIGSNSIVAQEFRVTINGGWRFKQFGTEKWFDAEVPGVVHTDLMRHGLIPDPYRNMNVDSVQWIEMEDWVYAKNLMIDSMVLGHEHLDLLFKGLDTFAEVRLNGVLIGEADNMFREWRWPIKHQMRIGLNVLEIVFRSPVKEGMRRREAYGLQLPHDSDPSGVAPYIRKAAYHFGWDFAPRLVCSGIWQGVELEGWGHYRLEGLHIGQDWDGDDLLVEITVGVFPAAIGTEGLSIRALLDGELVATGTIDGSDGNFQLKFRSIHPERWWPSGSGNQPMHDLRLELRSNDRLLSVLEKRMGWRTIELDRSADSIGTAFTFKVNGKPIFMKGCNVVPPDMFLPRAGDSAWVALVRHMAHGNMNMVRIWGGGVYPPDAFFDACDTAGIMVWQDFAFAYLSPMNEHAQRSIESEVADQLSRFAYHPCIAVLCGNNELEVAWKNWGWQARYGYSASDSARIWSDQVRLFNGPSLKAPVEQFYQLPYVATSPLSNWGSSDGLKHGSLHYWGVWHGDSTFAAFRNNVGRFVSEFGFQSWPDSAMMARYIDPSELYRGSATLERRQGSYKGDKPITQAMERELGNVPQSLEEYCKASQLVQSLAHATAISAHLEARPRCMGTLLWQLNDVWPAPSWSIIDSEGNRKTAYHRVRALYKEIK